MEIDLGNISDRLKQEFPEIEEIYLFGSRRYNTDSTRSDIDLLIQFSSHVRQRHVLEFSEDLCPALDIFELDNGSATSFHNDSYIEYENKTELINGLNAIAIWNDKDGRLKADIDWVIEIDERASYPPTALPNSNLTASEFPSTNPAELEIRQLFRLIGKLKFGQFWGFLLGIGATCSLIFYLGVSYSEITNNNSNTENISTQTESIRSQKQPTLNKNDTTLNSVKTEEKNLEPYSPKIITADDDNSIVSLRDQNDLRQLSTFESGKEISSMPSNTYFFVSIFYLERENFDQETILDYEVRRFQKPKDSNFEVHRYQENFFLIGYLSESEVPRVSRFDGVSKTNFTIFPSSNPLTNNAIVIPFERIISTRIREIQIEKSNPSLTALRITVR